MLNKKYSLITGPNRGIGKSIFLNFCKNKSNIIACSRTLTQDFIKLCKDREKKFKIDIHPFKLDLTKKRNVDQLYNYIIKKNLPVDILINNAGILKNNLVQMTSDKEIKNIFEVNFFSQFYLTKLISKRMINQKNGSIIFIASSSHWQPVIGRTSYACSKSAIVTFSKILSKELGRYNIRVNSISPGPIKTDMLKDNNAKNLLKILENESSLRRVGFPDEIANVCLFLSSNLSTFITGQDIKVDGGL